MSGLLRNIERGNIMKKPNIYKKDGYYVCEYKTIKSSGRSVAEAFFNFILAKASSHLHTDETML